MGIVAESSALPFLSPNFVGGVARSAEGVSIKVKVYEV
jgi:hypothetical protein